MRALLVLSAVAAVLLAGCSAEPVRPAPAAPDPALPQRLAEAATGDGAYRTLEELQRIADTNGGNRALGKPGYDASVEYVAGRLREAGYQVETTSFAVRSFAPGEMRLAVGGAPVPAAILQYSPSTPAGGARGPLAVIAQDATSGCEATDFAGIPAGAIVLVRRGTCPFAAKATTAAGAGAAGILVANNADGPLDGATMGADSTGTVPAVGLSKADGDALAARAGTPVELTVATTIEETTTRNIVAQTTTGDPGKVVMAGSHLDSVPAGPGINDNGSGSAALLETAVALGAAPPVANAVRFAWWGAEEEGLVGSTNYVKALPEPERKKIAAYLNFDMVASPNTAYLVYDGDDSDHEGSGPGPAGSAAIERLLAEALSTSGVTAEGTDFDGRSDYGPFIEAGIPGGGIFTGAEGLKSAEQAQRFGGVAGQAFDPCYHQACDRIDKIDRLALDRNVDAIATVIARLALSTDVLAQP